MTRLTKSFSSAPRDTGVYGYRRLVLAGLAVAVSVVSCARPALVQVQPNARPTPTVSGTTDYRAIERDLVSELNAARANPSAYAVHLSAILPLYSGNLSRRDTGPAIQTQEGAAAVREAIDALKQQAPVPRIAASAAMSLAARDLAVDQSRTGAIGHAGSDGSSPETRLSRYGQWKSSYNENVDYGPFRSARDVVTDLLIDDGVANRGHRHNIFDSGARLAGIACAPHPQYGSVCVIDQAAGFTPR